MRHPRSPPCPPWSPSPPTANLPFFLEYANILSSFSSSCRDSVLECQAFRAPVAGLGRFLPLHLPPANQTPSWAMPPQVCFVSLKTPSLDPWPVSARLSVPGEELVRPYLLSEYYLHLGLHLPLFSSQLFPAAPFRASRLLVFVQRRQSDGRR